MQPSLSRKEIHDLFLWLQERRGSNPGKGTRRLNEKQLERNQKRLKKGIMLISLKAVMKWFAKGKI